VSDGLCYTCFVEEYLGCSKRMLCEDKIRPIKEGVCERYGTNSPPDFDGDSYLIWGKKDEIELWMDNHTMIIFLMVILLTFGLYYLLEVLM